MSDDYSHNIYDAYYFAHSCGLPYKRDEHWLTFFNTIAERIAVDLKPASVLDAGCAMGFLVEKLRDHDIEAFGIDISKYALDQVDERIKPYCWFASVTDPLERDFGLIVCIEVLEHLSSEEAQLAIEQFCEHSECVLFSSSPDDFSELSHKNVRPPEYWAGLFAIHGFYRDLDFDSNFITPWAMLFRKEQRTLTRSVQHYERAINRLQKENSQLRESSLAIRNKLASIMEDGEHAVPLLQPMDIVIEREKQAELLASYDERLKGLRNTLSSTLVLLDQYRQGSLELRNLEREILSVQGLPVPNAILRKSALQEDEGEAFLRRVDMLFEYLEGLNSKVRILEDELHEVQEESRKNYAELTAIQAHVGWRMVQLIQRIRIRVFPLGSSRERLWTALIGLFKVWFDLGFGNAMKKVWARTSGKPIRHTVASQYIRWIQSVEPSEDELMQKQNSIDEFATHPVISFITPVYNPPVDVLSEMVESVLAQIYPHWELCLVDGASENPAVRETLQAYANSESRIKVKFLAENEGIAGNSNHALELARGEFVALLDHDDTLAPNMLYEVVCSFQAKEEIDIVYFDEDKLSGNGKDRLDPWFKPDWSPEMLLSANYLMHSVIRRSIVENVGGFDERYDGAQDWDLLLRCTHQARAIVHIPQVLYHWRQIPGSAASALMAKPWVFDNQKKCVQNHLKRRGIEDADAYFPHPGFLRVTWPTPNQLVSIIIPTRNNVEMLRRLVDSIRAKTDYYHYEIIIVDNQSDEVEIKTYLERLDQHDTITVVPYNEKFNFSRANNLGESVARGDLLLFLNNDTEILEKDWLNELVQWAWLPEIGVVGAKLLYPNGDIQHAGVIVGMQGHASHVFMGAMEKQTSVFGSVEWYRNYLAVTGACMMMRREIFHEVGGFDESFDLVFSDIDLCLRADELGYRNMYTPFARLRHYEGQSRGHHIPANDIVVGYERMRDRVARGDPYYNPNLSYAHQMPALAFPDEEQRLVRLERILRIHKPDYAKKIAPSS